MKRLTWVVLLALLALSSLPCDAGAAPEAHQALQGLQEVRSTLSVGVSYLDYTRRVADAKIRVDRYLAQPERGDRAAREAINEAVEFYRVASIAWRISATLYVQETRALGAESALDRCGQLRPLLARRDSSKITDGSVAGVRGLNAARDFKILWSCASDKIAEAEKLLGAK